MNLLKKWTALLSIVIAVGTASAFATEARTQVLVEGMTCQSCATSIKKSLMKNPEVKSVEVDVEAGTVLLTFQPEKSLTEKQIKDSVKSAGYKVTKISAAKKS